MPRFITIGIVILFIAALFSPCSAMQAVSGGQATQKDKSAATSLNTSSQSSVQREVVNIVVDRIEDGAIYSKEGKKYQITSSTKVVNNSKTGSKVKIAELDFENGNLVAVIIK